MTEHKTAKIELRVEPSLKRAALDFATSKGRPLSDILRQGLVAATGWTPDE